VNFSKEIKKMIEHWRQILTSATKALYSAMGNPDEGYHFSQRAAKALRPYLPYCLQQVDDRTFIWVNRDYKPLGIIPEDYVDYHDYPWLVVGAAEPVAAMGWIYLFDDGCPPWRNRKTAERLIRLIDALVDPDLDLRDKESSAFTMLLEVSD
jgi:hypothetical protein